ncbi:MAG: alpha/beta hydrolase [Deltaproteobacteria bacterium]|nr:alpha/beta hydrolase [Deltaproteobacteria bacterium]MBI3386241.1 alpha/beta hydrolase [Deltaproteobacteria bacterium]
MSGDYHGATNRCNRLARVPGRLDSPRVLHTSTMPEYSERFFRSGTLRIHFRDWGNADAPPLIIVHGMRDHSHSFDDLARGLLDQYHVLALDLRGHGDSETTPYYSFGHFVLDLHNMVRALRLERPVLIGHSMGGEVVGHFSGCFPDVPSRLVIIEGLGPPPSDMEEEVRWTIDGFARTDRAFAGHPGLKDLDAAYRRLRERNPRLLEAKARELALLGTRAREDGTLEWKFDSMLTTMSLTGPYNLAYHMALWQRITAPALLIHGAESGEFWREKPGAIYLEPDDLQRRLGCFHDARFVEIAGAGHMVHFDRPRELVTAIRQFVLGDKA